MIMTKYMKPRIISTRVPSIAGIAALLDLIGAILAITTSIGVQPTTEG
jgi:hypothetical protein